MRIALRASKYPWEVERPLTAYRRNTFGNNVGNLVFSHAAHRSLMTSSTLVQPNRFVASRAEADRINNEADVFVVPLANAFRPSFADALERLTDMIERLRVPVVVLGVGAQSGVSYNARRLDGMSVVVKRFASAVLDRSAAIGVRGEFTADYLGSLGFSDVEVIGCPAMYLWGDQLRVTPKVDVLRTDSRLSVGVSPYVKAMGPILSRQLKSYNDLTYLAQDRETLGRLVAGRIGLAEHVASDLPVHGSHPVFTEDKVRFFLDPAPWIEHLRTRDFYVGTRIHGAIAALLAGTPALVLAHDSRTLELAEYHRIPHVRIKDVAPDTDAAQWYADLDFGPMHAAHAAGFARYTSFLERSGLPHVWQPGESPAEFDRLVAGAHYPAAVRSPRGVRRAALKVASRGWHLSRDLQLRTQRPQHREEPQIPSLTQIADAG